MELILIRHGLPEVEVNEDGTPADPALSAEGRVQADKLAVWMARSGIDRIYSSPMQRALQTSEPLAATLNLPVEVIDAVAEFDRDAGSYVPLEVIKETDPERYRAVVSYDTDARFESFQSAVVGALSLVADSNRGKRVAVACHGGVINVWAAHVIGLAPKLFFNPYYTSVNRFLIAGSGERSVVTLNDRAHLLEHG